MGTRGLCKLGIVIGLANYLVYAVTASVISGDALHGHVAHDHFFVTANGGLVEVSRALFLFCKWQAYSLLLTFPVGLLGACFLTPSRRDDAEFAGGHRNAGLSIDTP